LENNIPKKKIKASQIIQKTVEELTEFDLLPIKLDRMIMSQNGECLMVVVAQGKQVVCPINGMESTMLTYIQSGCVDKPHIKTIYHIYIDTMTGLGNTLESGVIEAQLGDVLYGRLKWKNAKGDDFYLKCSVGDVLILSSMMKGKIYIVRRVLDDMDSFDTDYEEDEDDMFI
jgi:bifunctional DNase/RNase